MCLQNTTTCAELLKTQPNQNYNKIKPAVLSASPKFKVQSPSNIRHNNTQQEKKEATLQTTPNPSLKSITPKHSIHNIQYTNSSKQSQGSIISRGQEPKS
jgi:hypothetical protein